MGDRCEMTVVCAPRDQHRFDGDDHRGRVYDFEFVPSEGRYAEIGAVEGTDPEVNYGNTEDLPHDVPFIGWHGPGSGYPAGVFACDGEEFVEWESLDGESPAIAWPDGGPGPRTLETAGRYWEIQRRAVDLIRERSAK